MADNKKQLKVHRKNKLPTKAQLDAEDKRVAKLSPAQREQENRRVRRAEREYKEYLRKHGESVKKEVKKPDSKYKVKVPKKKGK